MEHIVLSMDLSENERARNKDTNRYLDAKELLERYSEVKQVQIYREKRLEPFEAWCTGYPNAFVELEFRFDKGITHRIPCDVQIDERNLWFHVRS